VENVIGKRGAIDHGVISVSPEAVCLERKLLIPKAKVEDVTVACHKILKEMGLKT
jgi:hypothetical protein